MRQRKFNVLILVGIIGVFTVGTTFAIYMYRASGRSSTFLLSGSAGHGGLIRTLSISGSAKGLLP
ncbi:MAG: hypothetical protein JW836_03220 [Deltaproteobacteria bacterium]|nr:hypothetical protein [Deltaproteobacteria bacterium]